MIRVLRIMEYTYEDAETMVSDMAHWQTPQNGLIHFGDKKTLRCATLPIEVFLRSDVEPPYMVKSGTQICTEPWIGKPPHCGDPLCFKQHR